jgi:hypothetical protein
MDELVNPHDRVTAHREWAIWDSENKRCMATLTLPGSRCLRDRAPGKQMCPDHQHVAPRVGVINVAATPVQPAKPSGVSVAAMMEHARALSKSDPEIKAPKAKKDKPK